MSSPRVFISFDYDHDSKMKDLFAGQSVNSRTPFTIQDWSAKSSMPQSTWEGIVEDKIKRCNMLIVLVGNYMRSAYGVAREISFAKQNNVPVYGVYIYSSSSNLPDGLPSYKTVSWSWEAITGIINKAMREGKNL